MNMPKGKIIVFMGSKTDYDFASRIDGFLRQEEFGIECEYVIASAHKTPQKLLEELGAREKSDAPIVFITVAGLSDALSGVVAGFTKHPVVACPPDSEKFWEHKLLQHLEESWQKKRA